MLIGHGGGHDPICGVVTLMAISSVLGPIVVRCIWPSRKRDPTRSLPPPTSSMADASNSFVLTGLLGGVSKDQTEPHEAQKPNSGLSFQPTSLLSMPTTTGDASKVQEHEDMGTAIEMDDGA